MMDTAILRSRILDLAIQGKLVEQDSSEGTAEELLKEIGEQRGKIVEPVTDDVPFDVPESWRWVRLGEISNYGKCTVVDISNIHNEAWILELEDLEKETARIIQRLSLSERQIKGIRRKFNKGDILYSKLRTYLNKVLIAPEDGYCTTEIVPFVSFAYNPYICLVLRSPYYLSYTAQLGYGVKMPRLGTSDALKSLIPLPPFAEQKRIVERVEELFREVDVIEKAQDDIKQVADVLRSKILDMAMRGELTNSDTSEWKSKIISDVTELISTRNSQIKSSAIISNGKYPVVSQSQTLIDGYCNEDTRVINTTPIVLFGDHTRNVKYIDFPFVVGADGTKLHYCTSADSKFIFYWMMWIADNMVNRGYERHYSLLKQTELLLPSQTEQKRIVEKIEELFGEIDVLTGRKVVK